MFITLQGWVFGWLRLSGYGWQSNPLGAVLLGLLFFVLRFAFVSVREELLVRGYQLQNLEESIGRTPAVVISSLLFSLLHIRNAGFNLLALVGLPLAGALFAYAFHRSGQLWLPIGLHLGWSFFEGPVFGFPVSGLQTFSVL